LNGSGTPYMRPKKAFTVLDRSRSDLVEEEDEQAGERASQGR